MIDILLVEGFPKRRIASQFGMSEASVRRHADRHLSATLQKSHEIQEVARAGNLNDRIQFLDEKVRQFMDKFEEDEDYRGAVDAAGELRRITELYAKVRGDLKDTQTINFHFDADWIELRTLIFTAIEPYPKAKTALIKKLEEQSEQT
jgi:hypothetical protein